MSRNSQGGGGRKEVKDDEYPDRAVSARTEAKVQKN